MYWREVGLLLLSLATKLGFHPCTKVVMVAIYAIPRNNTPLGKSQLRIADIGYIPV